MRPMKRGNLIAIMLTVMLISLFLSIPLIVFASSTDGTIDTVSKYAWSSKAGWINFGATNGNIHISDSAITGNAWNDLYGWILMNPTMSGVVNDGNGTLSGYAWNANLGWVNFTGVTIGASGDFSGTATGDNYGTINFSCTNCGVRTDWRPQAARPACNNALDDDGDGKIDYPTDGGCDSLTDTDETDNYGAGLPPVSGGFIPAPSYFMVLNNDAVYTASRQTPVTLRCGSAEYAWLSEDSNFIGSAFKIDCDTASAYTQSTFMLSDGEGLKTVFAKFCNHWGQCSDKWSDSIVYSLTAPVELTVPALPVVPEDKPVAPSAEEQESSLFQNIKNYLSSLLAEIIPPEIKLKNLPLAKLITEKLLPKLKSFVPSFAKQPPPLETIVSSETPRSMAGGPWKILDMKSIQKFVFAPLPREFLSLANKLPAVKNTFDKVGIKRMSDLKKLKSVSIKLPGLSRVVGLKTTSTLALSDMAQFKTTPIAELPKNFKNKIPTDMIFTRGANELVDINMALTLSDKGQAVQKIKTISGKSLELFIKPDHPVKSVRGYVFFKSRTRETASVLMPLAEWFNSLVFAEPVLAYSLQDSLQEMEQLENKLVLQEFEYTDPDKDGIYTASIIMPAPEGEYEILTVMDYEDPDLGMKQVRLITVVDPEGYVYEKIRDQELRVRGAVVSLYWLNKKEKHYELWLAADYQQENSQITDARGTYSFLVPEGTYYLTTEAPGYAPWEGKPFRVEEGSGVHFNIELKTKYWWLNMLDWRTLFLVVIGLLLVYNFYKDRKRRQNNT